MCFAVCISVPATLEARNLSHTGYLDGVLRRPLIEQHPLRPVVEIEIPVGGGKIAGFRVVVYLVRR